MGNCTGLVWGTAKDSAGNLLSGVTVDINWMQAEGSQSLQIGGDVDLKTPTARATTTSSGNYVIPFFWQSYQVPGSLASAHAMQWLTDSTYKSINNHGQLVTTVDGMKLFGMICPSVPTNTKNISKFVVTIMMARDNDLKGVGILKRFLGNVDAITTELQGCYSNINFVI